MLEERSCTRAGVTLKARGENSCAGELRPETDEARLSAGLAAVEMWRARWKAPRVHLAHAGGRGCSSARLFSDSRLPARAVLARVGCVLGRP